MDPSGPTSDVVLDASVFIDLLVQGRDGRAGRQLDGVLTFVVPSFFDAEVISALRRRRLRGDDGGRLLAGVVDALADPRVVRVSTDSLNARIVLLADNLTPFDASYVALAEALGLALLTMDAGLGRSSGPTCRIEVL